MLPARGETHTAPTFDLQSHSRHSDGSLPAREVVARAARAGVELLALTDHDTVAGLAEAQDAAREHGIRLSPAIELSCVHGEQEGVHLLGYELDPGDAALAAVLADWRTDRGRRVEAMAERLRELGFALRDAELRRRAAVGEPLGRPHLADAVLGHPANAARLREEGIGGRDDLFAAHLVPGAAAYVGRTRPTVAEAIALVRATGGVAVWAHPFCDTDEPEAWLDGFVADGLDGVECFYPSHSRVQTERLHRACRERGLLSTGSSDFHGPEHERHHRFRDFSLHGLEPELGPIGYASSASRR